MIIKIKDIIFCLKEANLLKSDDLNYSYDFLNFQITGSSMDSRLIKPGEFFIAIKGERFDSHNFLNEIFNRGASFAFVSDKYNLKECKYGNKCIQVSDTLLAYQTVARMCMKSFNGIKIGLTGSAGKTTVKEWLYNTLSLYGKTFATDGNKNSIYGLPWTIIKNALNDNWNKYEYGIFEMSMSGFGEISSICKFIYPSITLVNNIYPMHMEYFKEDGLKGIAKAKAEIFKYADIAIYNSDTNYTDILLNNIDCDFINFGKKSEIIKLIDYNTDKVSLKINDKLIEYSIGAGNTDITVYNSMAVLSVIYSLGLAFDKAIDNMKNLFLGIGRGKIFKILFNNKNLTLIDHSYSGQPDSVLLAIDDFFKIKHDGRKVFIFGNMSEIGDSVIYEHIRVAEKIKQTDIDIVYGIGNYTDITINELQKTKIETEFFKNVDNFLSVINNKLQDNDLILIKGSHYSSSVFKIVEFLTK